MHPLLSRYARMTGDDPDVILAGSMMPALRVNTLRAAEEELVERLSAKDVSLSKVPFLPQAYTFDAPFSLGATEEYLLGYYYLQEAASQLPVVALGNVLELQDATILDMAAAPGSKTTQLAAAMDNNGTLVAIDADMNRCRVLADNLERCGVSNCTAYVKDGRYVEDLDMTFDAVLLDAPCSGNVCLQDDWLGKRTLMSPHEQAETQRELLEAAWKVLKPGGVLLYSTCSLEPEEDEAVLDSLPADAGIIDMGLGIGEPGRTKIDGKSYRDDVVHARRLWPHIHGTQGFFLAAVRKP